MKNLKNRVLLICFVMFAYINGYAKNKIELNNLTNFSSINLELKFKAKVYITQSQTFRVTIQGEEENLEEIKSSVKNNKLVIESKSSFFEFFGSSNDEIEVNISMPLLVKLDANGNTDVKFENKWIQKEEMDLNLNGGNKLEGNFEIPSIKFSLNGSGDVDAKVYSEMTKIEINGSGDIELEGNSKKLSVSVNGSGDVKVEDLEALEGNMSINGSGNIKSKVSEKINVSISGSGDVINKGNPSSNISISGSGNFKTNKTSETN